MSKQGVSTRFARVGGILALVVAFASMLSAQQPVFPPPASGAVGVMRRDGVFLPLATVQKNMWRALAVNRQGGGSRLTPEARKLGLDGWQLIRPRGGSASFALTKPVSVSFECSRSEVFDTTMASGKRLSGADTSRMIGIGVQGDVPIEPAADLSAANDPRSRRIRDLIARTAQAMETERFESFRVEDRYRNFLDMHKFSAADRAKRPLRFRRLWYHKNRLTDWYYFEAQKDYPEVGRSFAIMGWIGAFGGGDESAMVDVQAAVGGGLSLDDPVDEQAEVLAVVPARSPADGATWIMSRRTTLDLTFTLYQVGVGSEYTVRRVVDIGASHCIP